MFDSLGNASALTSPGLPPQLLALIAQMQNGGGPSMGGPGMGAPGMGAPGGGPAMPTPPPGAQPTMPGAMPPPSLPPGASSAPMGVPGGMMGALNSPVPGSAPPGGQNASVLQAIKNLDPQKFQAMLARLFGAGGGTGGSAVGALPEIAGSIIGSGVV